MDTTWTVLGREEAPATVPLAVLLDELQADAVVATSAAAASALSCPTVRLDLFGTETPRYRSLAGFLAARRR
jgi:hypothetical protein